VYSWEYMGEEQRRAADELPADAAVALQEFMTAASLNPWGIAPDGSGNMPTVWFGNGRGMVSYLIMDEDRMLYITQVLWLG
jgi:hypothetical protein